MRQIEISEILHENTNEITQNIVNTVTDIKVVTKIDDALKERGLTQSKLAKLTGLRPTTITELVKGERQLISKAHITAIMVALRITDVREILDIQFEEKTVEQFNKEADEWKQTKAAPEEIKKIYKQNIMISAEAEAESDI